MLARTAFGECVAVTHSALRKLVSKVRRKQGGDKIFIEQLSVRIDGTRLKQTEMTCHVIVDDQLSPIDQRLATTDHN